MNKSKLTNLEISSSVNFALANRGWSVRFCCNSFNSKYKKQIDEGVIRALDKDFVQRVRRNKFEVITPRVSNLCDFLGVDISLPRQLLQNEFQALEEVAATNPILERNVKVLLKGITDILTMHTSKIKEESL